MWQRARGARCSLFGGGLRAWTSQQLSHVPSSLPQGYQFNHLVQRTDVSYPTLWVAPGSGDGAVGRALGVQGDFVTGAQGWCEGERSKR